MDKISFEEIKTLRHDLANVLSNLQSFDRLFYQSPEAINDPKYNIFKSIINQFESVLSQSKATSVETSKAKNDSGLKSEVLYAVLIDDDSICREIWNVAGKDSGKKVLTYGKIDEFRSEKIELDTPIFVDWNLGDNVSGETALKTLNILGFRNLYISSGEELTNAQIEKVPFIKGNFSKDTTVTSLFYDQWDKKNPHLKAMMSEINNRSVVTDPL